MKIILEASVKLNNDQCQMSSVIACFDMAKVDILFQEHNMFCCQYLNWRLLYDGKWYSFKRFGIDYILCLCY